MLGVRPEHVRLADDGSPCAARCSASSIWVRARSSPSTPRPAGCGVRTPNSQRAAIGERVGLAFDPDQILLFDPATERALPSALFAEAAGHG